MPVSSFLPSITSAGTAAISHRVVSGVSSVSEQCQKKVKRQDELLLAADLRSHTVTADDEK